MISHVLNSPLRTLVFFISILLHVFITYFIVSTIIPFCKNKGSESAIHMNDRVSLNKGANKPVTDRDCVGGGGAHVDVFW